MSTIIGNVYRQSGDLSVTDEGIAQVGITRIPRDAEQLEEMRTIRGINESLRTGVITTLEHDAYRLSKPPSNDDLDRVAEFIAIRTRGEMTATHSCPSLDIDAPTDEQSLVLDEQTTTKSAEQIQGEIALAEAKRRADQIAIYGPSAVEFVPGTEQGDSADKTYMAFREIVVLEELPDHL